MKSALAVDPFAPLSTAEVEEERSREIDVDVHEAVPIIPVPTDVPPVSFRHVEWGQPSMTWPYRNGAGRVLGHVARFDPPGRRKQFMTRTWCRFADGTCAWKWRAFSTPRPLYGLDHLGGRTDAAVLVVEGEKTADAARRHFPELITVTWPNGTNAVDRAGWTVLAGRAVTVWPDADEPGRKAAEEVVKLVSAAGADSVAVVPVPGHLPKGWDLADEIPEALDIHALLAAARQRPPETEWPYGYSMTKEGVWWCDPNDEGKLPLLLAGPFRVVAETRDSEGNSWGVLLEWRDNDARLHRHPIPRATLAGDGAEVRRMLLDGGLFVGSGRGAREKLTACLAAVRSSGRVTATNRIGWHGSAFVLPDECIGAADEGELLLQGMGALDHSFRQKGTLREWQNDVARYAIGNSRLGVALSAAFAAALVGPSGAENGGIHFRGPSSIGKSTALIVAGSVWGGGDACGYIRSWRATTNGLEGVALGHHDALLCLDELAQIAPREAGEVAYLLANGAGKSRSARDGSARRAARWRLLFLSSGEIGLADKVSEDGRGRRLSAGQEVRIVDIPADAGCGLGLFEILHGFDSPEALARHLRTAAASSYGTVARLFLKRIAGDLDSIRAAVAANVKDFVKIYVPGGADGQVHRVAQRFALIAAAGEIAVQAGILPWPEGEATKAAARVYQDWVEARGGVEPAEIRNGIEQVRSFILANGMSRFVPAWESTAGERPPNRDIAGFRKFVGEAWEYYVTCSAWRTDVCSGLDPTAVAKHLAERGLLMRPKDDAHCAKLVNVPGYRRLRLYHLPARILEADGDD